MEQVACDLCSSSEAEVLFPSTLDGSETHAEHFRCTSLTYGQHYQIVRCARCGLIYANPRPAPGEVLANYEELTDPLYVEESEAGRKLTFRKNFRPLQKLAPQGGEKRLLDIGCYTGVFLEVAQGAGWEAWGVEPCLWATKVAQEKGLRVEPKTLEGAEFPA
ncbi:MAG: methyltransferase domain-containing protein, partial [Chloroflexota bacterium]|nr:methyltransferase domain-containing protein [Chloroflexota bacterium]